MIADFAIYSVQKNNNLLYAAHLNPNAALAKSSFLYYWYFDFPVKLHVKQKNKTDL